MKKARKVQEAPNIMPRFFCPDCGTPVKNHVICELMHCPSGFKFCPMCGEEMDYTEKGGENA